MYFYSANYLTKIDTMCELEMIKDFDNITIEIEKIPVEGFYSDNEKLNAKITGMLKKKPQFSILIKDILHCYTLSDIITKDEDLDIFKNKNIACKFYLKDKIMQFILDDKPVLTYPIEQVSIIK